MNPNQQFCLRWNNHQSTLISVFEALLESGTLVDCTLAAEGQYLKAHKVVLSACSPYLGMLLSQDFEKHPILILKDVKFAQLKSMLDYMYRGEVNISQDQLGTFLKAAESLQIKGLTDSGNGNSNSPNSEDDYNARHRKHLALMAAAQARSRSPIIEHQQQHQRWMGNGMHDMMRDGSISPSPRRRKRPRRPSLGHNPLQNGHDEMPLQPLIQQAQATTNNVLAQSLAAPPLTQPPKCVSPPRPATPVENTREEEEISSPSPKEPIVEHNNNVNILKAEIVSPEPKDNGVLTNNNNSNMNNNHSNSVDVPSDDEASDNEDRKKEEMMKEEQNNEDMEEEGEEEMDEDSRSAHVQGPTMAAAHWLMASDASLPNSDSFQDSKENDITKLWKGHHYLQSWDAWSAHYPSVPSLLQRAALSNSPPSPSGDKGVECPNCGRHYKLKSSLRNHQKWECGKEPQFQCPYCNYRAKQKMHVARHIERMHREKLGILEGGAAASPIASILPGANPQQTQTILQ